MRRDERGPFAAELLRRWPGLLVAEGGHLNDPHQRENLIERVFCRNRWRALVGRGQPPRRLVELHTAHELLIRAHNDAAYQRLDRLVGSPGKTGNRESFEGHETEFLTALCTRVTNKGHANVVQHARGHMKTALRAREARVLWAIEDYRRGPLPLVVPLNLLRYDIRNHQIAHLAGQIYFDQHPKELMLRSHS